MKKLEFKTRKGEFILLDVDSIPSVEKTHPLCDPGFYKASNIEFNLFGEKVKTICRLSDITEEQASEVVLKYEHQPSYIDELFYRIKSKGVHLFENPYDRYWRTSDYIYSEDYTFYNPYLFKKI